MSDSYLVPAPGAKAAKICGILAILFALTCIGFPVAIILAIVALVKQGQAKRLVRAQPEVYEPVPATALVTGILGLVLPVMMVPVAGIVSAIAIPALLGQRERAREIAVQANLNAAKAQADVALQAIHAKAPGQVPSQDAIIQALSRNPLIQSLKNPVTPTAPAFQRGTSGPLGTVMVYADREQEGGVTTWTLQFRATVRHGGQDRILKDELITHTQEQVQGRTEDGWEVVQPAPEAPTPQN
ncbi:hypothetical protein GETHLI_21530 [Geothrix limicola]|uniref:DUF4190 domain-containing protein n=1 Tax=Geothrix limicola TaxID=2927978 RepID=A0ABQ5QGI8_9BACT|nr:hypothetical protein [Geothrix limicola]GLH73651.1 hypothetical protein GETHLI_21530 [Geothrix limicola]